MFHLVTPRLVHIIGAGLAGLSAAVDLARRGIPVILHEATQQAGGRCRSYADLALDMEIDNGNHLILSGNRATLAYLDQIGARDTLSTALSAAFAFVDLKTNERWTVQANNGPIPWWIFVGSRNVPGVPLREYLDLPRLLFARKGASIGETLSCAGPLYERLLEPFLLAALNIDPREASAELAGAVIRDTLAAGGRRCLPMISNRGLSHSFVSPALRYINSKGGILRFGCRLRALSMDTERVTQLDFADSSVALPPGEAVVLAVPPQAAKAVLSDLTTPTGFRGIVNAHYRCAHPKGLPPMIGVINGLAQWVFAFPDRLSVTISAADHLWVRSREDLAEEIWRDVAAVANISGPMPPWQIVRERRATFAASPEEDAKRPSAHTPWNNLALAGDWIQTGLPATIEGAIRSGVAAARIVAPN